MKQRACLTVRNSWGVVDDSHAGMLEDASPQEALDELAAQKDCRRAL